MDKLIVRGGGSSEIWARDNQEILPADYLRDKSVVLAAALRPVPSTRDGVSAKRRARTARTARAGAHTHARELTILFFYSGRFDDVQLEFFFLLKNKNDFI